MKILLPLLIVSCLLLSAAPVMAQSLTSFDMANKAVQEMQSSDPQAAQRLSSALQQGDIDGAKKIYLEFKRKQGGGVPAPDLTTQSTSTQALPPPSLFEQTLSGHFLRGPLRTCISSAMTSSTGPSLRLCRLRRCRWDLTTSSVRETSSR